jgi:heme exporter protein A
MQVTFGCENIEKKFTNRLIFRGVNVSLESGSSLAVTGRNGSGKSTLVKILANLLKETSGKMSLKISGKEIQREKYYLHTGFVAPYLNLYDELTAFENLKFFSKLKAESKNSDNEIKELLEKVNLYKRRNDAVKSYSSGMKQRLKYAFAVLSDPELLILDEPRSNLDKEGIKLAYGIAEKQKERGILIIATNDREDTEICSAVLNIEDYKGNNKS